MIHWGSSGDIEQYIQETGRAGRDGKASQAILYKIPMPGVEVDSSMKEYCKNKDICRRKILMKYFDNSYAKVSSSQQMGCQCVMCVL